VPYEQRKVNGKVVSAWRDNHLGPDVIFDGSFVYRFSDWKVEQGAESVGYFRCWRKACKARIHYTGLADGTGQISWISDGNGQPVDPAPLHSIECHVDRWNEHSRRKGLLNRYRQFVATKFAEDTRRTTLDLHRLLLNQIDSDKKAPGHLPWLFVPLSTVTNWHTRCIEAVRGIPVGSLSRVIDRAMARKI
jgi:hypothetical protein